VGGGTGIDRSAVLRARPRAEQRSFFDPALAPLFDKPLVRWMVSRQLSLFGLGIPPAQYEALAGSSHMAHVLRERVERLACGFSLEENYFAWQAFGRRYPERRSAALPPYLRSAHFAEIRDPAGRPPTPHPPF